MKKTAYTLVAMTVAMAAAAQIPDKSLVVTLKDGTTARYNLAEIEHLTFGEPVIPLGEPTTGPYAVGDYWCDGTEQGVVVTVDAKGEYGTVAALADLSDKHAWSTGWDITGASDEEYGPANMATVAALDPTYSAYPAFKAVAALGAGWYLPAQKELQTMRASLTAINATLTARDLTPIDPKTIYWSSTEADQYMDAMAYTAWMDMPGMFAVQKQEPYKVRAFREFGEKPVPKYTVGTLCTEDGKTGLVYWVSEDGENARMISLTESKAAWGPVGTDAGASSDFDGEANLKAVKAADASLAGYPAFKAAADLGAGWYLPSAKELATVASQYTALNKALKAAGATELTSTYYWTSTQYATDAPNSATALSMADGSTLASSKSAERHVRAITWLGERPEEEKIYAVGDPYYEADEVVGIVYEISDGGKHGKVVALTNVFEKGRINAMWDKRANNDNYVLIGASSLDDGMANMAAARANDPELANFTALGLCAAKGDGWYIGATNEMLALYAAKATVDAACKAHGGKALDTNDYWTSTEGTDDPTVRMTTVSFKNGTTFDYRKYMYQLVRPIKRF
ncbi:MAG: DUF1566 domain-containing protein [Bacteroides sp.]|nr:DUF1566 domain-containing protein [Bacteroides sp.]MCM1095855.1 DUF1566 domain-containing protein [Terasakiella sp.]